MKESYKKRKTKALNEMGYGPVKRMLLGDPDAQEKALEILTSNGVQDVSGEKDENTIHFYLKVASQGRNLPYDVDLTFEKLSEKEDGITTYIPDMKKTKHECKNTQFNIPAGVSDKHVVAALIYLLMKFPEMGEKYSLGKIESFMDPNILPQDIIDLSNFLKEKKNLKSIEHMKVVEAYKKARYASKQSG